MRTQRVFAAGALSLSLAVLCVAVSSRTVALASSADRAARVPIDVVEVVSGGNWDQGAARGFWRVVAIMVPDPTISAVPHCEVFVQWVGSRAPGAPFEILAAAPLTQFNALGLTSASVTLESEGGQGGRIVVTGEGQDRLVTLLAFVVRSPGDVALVSIDDAGAAVPGRSAQAARLPE
jgi:hypothetical protein